jgi:hypothetical protein
MAFLANYILTIYIIRWFTMTLSLDIHALVSSSFLKYGPELVTYF